MAEDSPSAVVLNVDDDEMGRHLTTRLLHRGGYTVVEASSGEEALERVKWQPIDVVVLDVHLPGLDGFQVAQRLKTDPATADLPILHLSASARDAASISHGLEAGADAYLTHPVSAEVLLATVGALVRAGRALQQARRRAEEAEQSSVGLRDAQRELEEQRALQEAILSQMPAGVMIADGETGRIYRMNPQASEVTGGGATLSSEVGHYSQLRALWPDGSELGPDDWQSVRALRTGRPILDEQTIVERPDGTRITVLASAAPVRDAEGKVVAVVVVLRDVTERAQWEALLDRYRLLSEKAHDIILFVRPDGRVAEANAAAEQAYGYTREELLSRDIRDLRAEQTVEEIGAQLAAANQEGLVFETWHRRKDGSTFPVEVSSQGADVGGERLLLSIIRDITERGQAEAALRESEERRRLAQEAAQAGTWEWDLRTNENFWSDELWGLYGLEPQSVIPSYETWLQTVVPEDRDRVAEITKRVAREGTDLNMEWRVREASGAERWLMSRGHPVRERWGRPVRYMGIVLDITERKLSEQALERSQALLTQAGQMAHLGVWSVEVSNPEDLNANPLTWSDEVYRIFGRQPGTLVTNELFFSSIPGEDRARVVEAVAEAIRARQPYSITHRVRRPDGTERVVQEHADLTFDEEGRLRRIVGAVQDITETVRAAERMAATERARVHLVETLNAEIAHRTKNNLTMAANVLRLQAMEETEERTVAALTDAASRLLTFASIHEQLQTTQEGGIDLLAALRRIVEGIREVYGAQGVEFSVNGAPLLLPSRLATSLAVVANELVTNAAKHGCTPEGVCEVRVFFGKEHGSLWLSVWNSGTPLAPDFTVTQNARLGLRLVKALVEDQYGGRFTLGPEDGGTCAEVVVPEEELKSQE